MRSFSAVVFMTSLYYRKYLKCSVIVIPIPVKISFGPAGNYEEPNKISKDIV